MQANIGEVDVPKQEEVAREIINRRKKNENNTTTVVLLYNVILQFVTSASFEVCVWAVTEAGRAVGLWVGVWG